MIQLQDFSGQNLQGRSFKGQDLTGANFSYANIRGADFSSSTLIGANFSHAQAGLASPIAPWTVAFLLLALAGVVSGIAGALANVTLAPGLIINKSAFLPPIIVPVLESLVAFMLTLAAVSVPNELTKYGAIGFWVAIALQILLGMMQWLRTGGWAGAAIFVAAWFVAVAVMVLGVIAWAVAFAVSRIVAGGWAVTFSLVTVALMFGAVVWVMAWNFNKAVIVAGAVTWKGSLAESLTVTGVVTYCVIVAVFVVGAGCAVGLQALAARNQKLALIRQLAVGFASTGGTSFRSANLTDANFTLANLNNTDFRWAVLTRTCWSGAENLNKARFSGALPAR